MLPTKITLKQNDDTKELRTQLQDFIQPVLIDIVISYYIFTWNLKCVDSKKTKTDDYIILDNNIIEIHQHWPDFSIKFGEQNSISFNKLIKVDKIFIDSPYIYIIQRATIGTIQYYTKKIDSLKIRNLQTSKDPTGKITSEILFIKNNTIYTYDLHDEFSNNTTIIEEESRQKYSLLNIETIYFYPSINEFDNKIIPNILRKKYKKDITIFVNDNDEINVLVRNNQSCLLQLYKLTSPNKNYPTKDFWCISVKKTTKIIYSDDFDIICISHNYGTVISCLNKLTKKVYTKEISDHYYNIFMQQEFTFATIKGRIDIYKNV